MSPHNLANPATEEIDPANGQARWWESLSGVYRRACSRRPRLTWCNRDFARVRVTLGQGVSRVFNRRVSAQVAVHHGNSPDLDSAADPANAGGMLFLGLAAGENGGARSLSRSRKARL